MTGWKEYRNGKPKPAERRLAILIIDDEERILESLGELFRDRYEVHSARGGEQGMKLFLEHRPQLVLCDQRMPGRTGIEILKEMKALEPGSIRMLITGYSDINVAIQAVNEEILARYITKPWVNADLLKIVEEGARRYLEENGLKGEESQILF